MRAAAIQLNCDSRRRLATSSAPRDLVAAAAAAGAELVVLPEKWNLLGARDDLLAGAESIDGRALDRRRRRMGARARIHLVAGSIAERAEGEERLFNTSCLIGPDGELVAAYRKIHMFDVDVGGVSYRESDAEQPGEEIVVAEAGGVRDRAHRLLRPALPRALPDPRGRAARA